MNFAITGPTVKTDFRKTECAFWRGLYEAAFQTP